MPCFGLPFRFRMLEVWIRISASDRTNQSSAKMKWRSALRNTGRVEACLLLDQAKLGDIFRDYGADERVHLNENVLQGRGIRTHRDKLRAT